MVHFRGISPPPATSMRAREAARAEGAGTTSDAGELDGLISRLVYTRDFARKQTAACGATERKSR